MLICQRTNNSAALPFSADERRQCLCTQSHANWYAICKRIAILLFFSPFCSLHFRYLPPLCWLIQFHRRRQRQSHILSSEHLSSSSSFVSIREQIVQCCALAKRQMCGQHTSDNKLHIYGCAALELCAMHAIRNEMWPCAMLRRCIH